ncbi:Protein kinase [uncultured virus]|nr:Protein kinase [uncultured virus]
MIATSPMSATASTNSDSDTVRKRRGLVAKYYNYDAFANSSPFTISKELFSKIIFNHATADHEKVIKTVADLNTFIGFIGVELEYIKSGTTGHVFKATNKSSNLTFAVKISAYPTDDKYGTIKNEKRPENVELLVANILSDMVMNTSSPHLVIPIYKFYTDIAITIPHVNQVLQSDMGMHNKHHEKLYEFMDWYNQGVFADKVSVLFTEWSNSKDMLDYIRSHYKQMTVDHWRLIFFQLLITLVKIHRKYPMFRHNDLKPNNILIDVFPIKPKRGFVYKTDCLNHKFIVPDMGISIKIWDFDFASIGNQVTNNKVSSNWAQKLGITANPNKYYDIHYFFTYLINGNCFDILGKDDVPSTVKTFIKEVIPLKYRILSPYKTDLINSYCRIANKLSAMIENKEPVADALFIEYNETKQEYETTITNVDIDRYNIISPSGRLISHDEYTSPEDILNNSSFFDCWKDLKTPT